MILTKLVPVNLQRSENDKVYYDNIYRNMYDEVYINIRIDIHNQGFTLKPQFYRSLERLSETVTI